MARIRNTNINPWKAGDNITIRLKRSDSDIIDYLNQPGRLTTEEFLSALELKMEVEKIGNGQSEIKPDQMSLLKEIENIIQIQMEAMEERIVKRLLEASQGLSFRDNESAAAKEHVDDEEDTNEDVASAMLNLGQGW